MTKKITKFLESKKGKVITVITFGVIGFLLAEYVILAENASWLHFLTNPMAGVATWCINRGPFGPFYLFFGPLFYIIFGFILTAKHKKLYLLVFFGVYIISLILLSGIFAKGIF